MQIKVKVPGSCGELAQGIYKCEPFLITCPIDIFSTVTLSDEFNGLINFGWKSKKMFDITLNYIGCKNFKFGMKIDSQLPTSKGMASSSADIAAVAKAVSLALNVNLTAAEICKLAAQIEPTDATFVEGIVAMNPITGQILKQVKFKNCQVAIFDFGGTINTVEMQRRSHFQINELPDIITPQLMIQSALANQDILFKPHLNEIINFAMNEGALSVNTAHSGTVIGIFFDDMSVVDSVVKRFKHIKLLKTANVINGGFY